MKQNKFRNKPKTVNGIKFQSTKEADFYIKLLMLKKFGEIKEIELQPRFDYLITYSQNDLSLSKKTFYKADFRVKYTNNDVIIYDVKGVRTPEFIRKKKIIEHLYNIKIIEV